MSVRVGVEVSMSDFKFCELDDILRGEETKLELLAIGVTIRVFLRQSDKRKERKGKRKKKKKVKLTHMTFGCVC